mmetsp:Transcript_63296/g.200189  ORF Transcript_63296/g.200189 Transcript_63296/m.200189 type:complete len:521 (+) Transcript_63296:181-1743(+)
MRATSTAPRPSTAKDPHPLLERLAREGEVAALLLAGVALLVRIAVGFHPYSGAGSPPMYGDYEAQRHWMEVTVHLPPSQWYWHDLQYWGLDYPPLTAYQSWLHGKMLHAVDPRVVALGESRGHESEDSKRLMRWTVLLSDAATFLPAAFLCRRALFLHRGVPPAVALWAFAAVLLQPPLVLIDHGHFQYNCISLGFAIAAAAAITLGRDLVGAALFCLSLNHKQMSLYYAPAFFAHLLGKSLELPTPLATLANVAKLGAVVVATFALCWLPFLGSVESAGQVLHRLFPFARGLYEDHVANFWCATSLVVKWKRLFTNSELTKMCLGTTLSACLPSMVHQMVSPSRDGLLMGMLNSSLAFFLFSFQVHEKSLLLAVVPATLLAVREPLIARWLPPVATFSMYPLLKRDGLSVAYVGCLLLWAPVALCGPAPPATPRDKPMGRWARGVEAVGAYQWRIAGLSAAGGLCIHLAELVVPPPTHLPHLFPAVFTFYAFIHLLPMWLYTNARQWALPEEDEKEKRQ